MKPKRAAYFAILTVCILLCRSATSQLPGDYTTEQRRANELLERTSALLARPASNIAAQSTSPTLATPPSAPASVSAAPSTNIPLSTSPASVPTTPAKKVALLVGINDYQAVKKLNGCVNDVKNMQLLLTGKFGFAPEDVHVLLDKDATHSEIVKKFKAQLIDRSQPDTIAVFHFSGHGSQAVDDGTENGEVDKMDETIVPVDSRTPGHYDITDDEINGLFKLLTEKTKNVTFVLDCCHSGGNVRATALARKVDPDLRPPPPAPVYARAEAPRDARGLDERFEGRDYVLIAGCRADQVSFEFADPNTNQPCGALTYFLVREIQNSAIGKVTYRDVMDKVKALVNKEYPTQHPQLEGAQIDKVVFNDASSIPQPFVTVFPQADGVRIEAGIVQGVTVGSVWDVYPPETKLFEHKSAVAQIEVTSVEAFSARAKRIQGTAVASASRALVRRQSYQSRKLNVYLALDEKSPALAKIKTSLESPEKIDTNSETSPTFSDLFEVVATPGSARIVLDEIDPNEIAGLSPDSGRHIALSAGDGSALSPPVPVTDPKVGEKVLNQVNQWKKWFNLLDIENPNPTNLKVDLKLELRTASWASGPKSEDEVGLVVRPKDELEVAVTNNGTTPIYFTLLDLETDGSIAIVYPPTGEQQSLAPQKPWSQRFRATLANDRQSVRGFIKLVATTQPADFSFLRQEQIKGLPKDAASMNNPLVRILGEASLVAKGLEPVQTNLDEWTTKTRILDVVRPAN